MTVGGASPVPGMEQAYALARELARTVLWEADASPGRKVELKPPARKARAERLAVAQLPALMLFAGVLVRTYEGQRKRFDREQKRRPKPIEAAELLEQLPPKASDPPPLDLAFNLVERYVCTRPSITTRTHYNLACFYTTLGQYERALRELDVALEDAALMPWARKDPSLDKLREKQPRRWKEVLEHHELESAPKEDEKEEEKEEKPPTLDSWRAATAVIGAELGTPRDVRSGADVDFEVDTEKGVALVDFQGGAAATEADVESLAAAAYRRRRIKAELAGLVLVLGPGTAISAELRGAAQSFDVRLMRLAEWPVPEPPD